MHSTGKARHLCFAAQSGLLAMPLHCGVVAEPGKCWGTVCQYLQRSATDTFSLVYLSYPGHQTNIWGRSQSSRS